jgi:chorismate mutase-like protein
MTLTEIRTKIDVLDGELVTLLNERMRLVSEVGQVKQARGQAIFAPEREELLLQALEEKNRGPLSRIGLRAIYREILSASRANQRRLRILYIGSEISQSFLAARLRFGASDCYRGETQWAEVARALEEKEAEVAVIPRSMLLTALTKPKGEKHFQNGLRVCGEIHLLRVMQPSDLAVDQLGMDLAKWQGPHQFFILAHTQGLPQVIHKSLFTVTIPGLDLTKLKIRPEASLNGQLLRSEMMIATKTRSRHFCEVEGTSSEAEALTWGQQRWGPQAVSCFLGAYPLAQHD